MLSKRIIPCLDVRDSRVVKGVNFKSIQDVQNPVEMAKFYNQSGADEIVFYDITASYEKRSLFTDILKKVAANVFIPLTVGGGINKLDDFDIMLKCGADKVSINTGAINDKSLISNAAKKYGNQCVVLSMDVKKVNGEFIVFSKGGRVNTGINAVQWAIFAQDSGAGEIVVNSIDTDGVKTGFDIQMLSAISNSVSIPIIASGGAGNMEHFKTLFQTLPSIDAGLAASIFHFKEISISELKQYLSKNNINVRI